MYKKILVAVDGSSPSRKSLGQAVQLAAEHNAALFALNVVDDFLSYEELVEFLRESGKDVLAQAKLISMKLGVNAGLIQRLAGSRRIADVIVDEARQGNYDLIVMGTHGRRGFARLALGSDAEAVVRISPVPVLLIR